MTVARSAPAAQTALFGAESPAKAGTPVFCHQEFLEKLHEHRNESIGKRASLVLHRLILDERRQYYKSTQGLNAGWRRSRLGGNQGSQFYAWWAPRGAPPFKGLREFAEAPAGAVFMRDIRHHDDHSELKPHSLRDHYLPVSVNELLQAEYGPLPWTSTQVKFASARHPVRIVKGYPGSGKTTALWQAAEQADAEAILFVTFSPDLAALAQDYFDKFAPRRKRFHVVTYPRLLRELLGDDQPQRSVRECRARFVSSVAGLSGHTLGPWLSNKAALFDEIHAHLAGAALPVTIGRFQACPEPRLAERAYRERREPALGKVAVDSLLDTVQVLRRREQGSLEEAFFPEVALARRAALHLRRDGAWQSLPEFECLAVDEAQDLTPIEALVLIELAVLQVRRRAPVSFLAAGDEAQTVRPTDFEWGWFHDLLHHRLGRPAEFKLATNLRSPRRIAELVNRVRELYSHIDKQERPSGLAPPEIDADAADQIVYCAAVPGEPLARLLETLSAREGLAIISLSETIPDYIPEPLRSRIFTVFEAKGLDFHSVCILDPGKHLDRITHAQDWLRRESPVEPLNKRLMIDQLRVAMSRPAERLYWLEVEPTPAVLHWSMRFLNRSEHEPAVAPLIPAAVMKSLEEETLPAEDRIRLCEEDASNYLEVKPELAWNRAKQAVALVGQPGTPSHIADETIHRSAHLTLSRISFCLAFRGAPLPAELGRPNLYAEAARHAEIGGKPGLAAVFESVAALENCRDFRPVYLAGLVVSLVAGEPEIEPWVTVELAAKAAKWLEESERLAAQPDEGQNLFPLLPALYRIFHVSDAGLRATRVRQQAIQNLMAAQRFGQALQLLAGLPEPESRLQAACYEGLGDFRKAAELYLGLSDRNAAIRNYRAVPDLERALELLSEQKDHPAAESLRWIRSMQEIAAQRPDNFLKVVAPTEIELLQEILEQSLGVTRKPRTARKRARPKSDVRGSRGRKARAPRDPA